MSELKISRRNFLKLGGAVAGASGLTLGSRRLKAMEQDLGGRDYSAVTGAERKAVPYTCLTCNIEDGGVAFVENGRIVKLEGNMDHPNTRGKLCAKGNSGWLHVYDPDRIMTPLMRTGKRGEGKWRRISYDEATSIVAKKLREVIDRSIREHDPGIRNEIVFKWGRNRTGGAIKRFMHALGSNSLVNHTNICESSKKVGLEPAWGPDIESCDWANTKYILNFGSNILEAAYFMNPNAQRCVDGVVGNKAKIVTFDVRMSNTAGWSDEWHAPYPGTDAAIALAMAHVIMNEGLYDDEFIRDWTNVTPEQLKAHLKPFTPEWAEKESGVSARDIRRIAREFATTKPATTFSYRGPCKHVYGSYQEAAIQMLNVITGNVETRGGYCLPRGMGWPQPEPVPPKPPVPSVIGAPPIYPLASHAVSTHAPYQVMAGEAKVSVWFAYYDNPVYTYPAAHVWERFLKDEKLVPFYVSFSPYMSETTELADLIIPDVTYLERHDPESMPGGLYPCLSIRQPVIQPLGGTQEFRQTLIDIIHKVDPDGSLGIKKYFAFKNPEEWMRAHFDNIPGLKEEGGWDFLKAKGVWPIYGKVDKETAKIVDRNGEEVQPDYQLHKRELSAAEMEGAEVGPDGVIRKDGHPIGVRIRGRNYVGFGTPSRRIELYKESYRKYGFNPLPTYKRLPSRNKKPDELVLTTYKVNVHTQSRTASIKYLAELYHKNPAWMNPKTAAARGLKDGDLIRITSPIGYMVTRVHVTEGIHPDVVAVSTACGHSAYGRLAQLKHKEKAAEWAQGGDPDITHNVWWDDKGVHPNSIIPVQVDPIGGSQGWYDTVVTVTKAQPGDKYGDVVADFEKAVKAYEHQLRYAYTGDLHRANHPEVDIDWDSLPKPEVKAGGH
ncbi:molybdopterin-dependent oxidoreductase [Inmirania thermothiophila]|uniref:Anaerobic selenocysteine-containing dehydrogenase n=1 Tax=Inmirania thermothiophila TaxID=1750597 RepID=A0A3N1XZE8_9GAMM|nr:molybdopterin-dependent oxidoreductase [Inmirania thermothiophila]ROR31963.1 anaerobic selenocysteine-containing dehydrogenase [Inmirania thermothiophila]